jgi:hypothetical protein
MKQGFRVIDTDLHVAEPPDLWDRLPEPYRSRTSIGFNTGGNLEVTGVHVTVGDVEWDFAFRLLQRHMSWKWEHLAQAHFSCDPQHYLKGMEIEGIDLALIVPSLTFALTTADGIAPDHAAAICSTYNDWVAEFCEAAPDKFRFWAWLPRQDAELAAAEARRCVKDLGAVAVAMTTGNVDRRLLSEPHFDPLWREIEELDVPLGLHLYGNAPRLHGDPLQRYLGRARSELAYTPLNGAFQGMTSVTEMIMGGVCERHPNLQPMIMEVASTWLIWLLQRMDEAYETFEAVIDEVDLSLAPSDYFRRQFSIAVENDELHLAYLADACGLRDNLVFTTDYPHHDSSFPHAVDNLLGLGLDEDLTRRILSENTERIFGWANVPA